MSKKSGGVKKGSTLPAMAMYKQIETLINAFNAKYGSSEQNTLLLTTVKEKRVDAVKVLAYSEQYAMDIALLACNEVFGAGADRLKRWNNVYIEKYKEYQQAAEDERATTDVNKEYDDGSGAVYTRECLERELQKVCGKHYEPMKERYKVTISYNGTKVAVTGIEVEMEVMSMLRGKTKEGEYTWANKKPDLL